MPLDPNNPFADLVPAGNPGVIQGPPKIPDVPSGFEPDPTRPGALRPQQGGPADPSANDTLDDQTTTFYAQQVLAGAPMPAMGMGKVASQNRQKVMMKVAELAGGQGLTGADLAKQIAHYQAGRKQLGTLEQQLGTTRQNETTALLNGQQFLDRSAELPGQTEYPALNAVTQFIQKNIPVPGHDTKVAMDAAYNTFVNEYAKVVSGSPSGAGVLSDSARREAMSVLTGNYSMTQKKAVFDQMKADMENRMIAMKGGINQGYDALVNKPGYEVPDATTGLPVGQTKQQDHIVIPGVTTPGSDGTGPSGGGDGPPGLSQMTPEQQAKDKAFLATNPTPEQYAAFTSTLLGRPMDVAAIADRLKAFKAGGRYGGGIDDSARIQARIAQENKLGLGESAATTLVKQGSTLNLSDEAAGVGNVLGSALGGNFNVGENYQLGRDVERQRIADARQQLGYGGTALELVGNLASANPSGALATLAPKAAAVAAGKAGAVGGALSGFGGGEGAQDSVTGLVLGGTAGAALGRYGPAVAGKIAGKVLPQRMLASPALAPEVAAAADAEGLSGSLIRPMVDPASRAKFGQLESNPVSQPIIRGAVGDMLRGIETRVKALGGGGVSGEADAIGDKVQEGGRNWLANRTSVKNRLYGRAEQIGADARFVPQKAIGEADAAISELSGNPTNNKAEIDFLNGMKSDLSTDGGKSIAEIRNLREGLSDSINRNGLTMNGAGVRALRVLNAAKADIADNVPQAAAAYQRADNYFSASQQIVDDLKAAVLGSRKAPLEPQVALQKLKNMMGNSGTGRRFARIMGSLDPQARQDVAATWAEALGRKAPDAPFSAGTFLEQTKNLSPSALRTAFGPEGAQSVKNLRVLSQALKDAGGDVNYTRSGSNVIRYMAQNFIARLTGFGASVGTGFMAGGETGAVAGAGIAAGAGAISAGKTVLSAKAMVNPKVSRWLADAAQVTNRTQAHTAMRKLSVIISRDPALSSELQPVYDRISAAFSAPMEMPLAAQPNDQATGNQQQ
jgi:hypothetical protein